MQFAFRKFVLPMDLISKNKDEQAKKTQTTKTKHAHTQTCHGGTPGTGTSI